jgi:hypothetical protein
MDSRDLFLCSQQKKHSYKLWNTDCKSIYDDVIGWAISCRLSLDRMNKIKTIGRGICTEQEKAEGN